MPSFLPAGERSGPAASLLDERLSAWPYSAAVRAERLLAIARAVLALFSLLTLFVEPAEPVQHARTAHVILGSYTVYSVLLLVVVWTSHAAVKPLQVVTQVIDLLVYTLFVALAESVTGSFFSYLVFTVLCGAVRWQWRGAVYTAAAAVLAYVSLGAWDHLVVGDPAFALDRFMFRGVSLLVTTGILATVGLHEARIRRELERLAAWPRPLPPDREGLYAQLLGHAALVLAAPRVLLVLDEPEEPWRQVALWSAGRCELRRVAPDRYAPPVIDALDRTPFMCRDIAAADVPVLVATREGLRERRGPVVHDDLRRDYAIHSVLALPLACEILSGWLFYLDKARLTTDDIALGTIAAREIVASLTQAEMVAIERQTAVLDERTRLGRDLHDGLLQSLTAARLQLHRLARQAPPGSESREKLQVVESSITANQRQLRRLVEELRPRDESAGARGTGVAEELDVLLARVRQEWGLEVEARIAPGVQLPAALRREVYLMVHEALVNAARHGGATAVELRVHADAGALTVAVADNGRGFPFAGRLDAAQMREQQAGPVSLRERVASLNGALVVESGPSGATVEMTIPIDPIEGV